MYTDSIISLFWGWMGVRTAPWPGTWSHLSRWTEYEVGGFKSTLTVNIVHAQITHQILGWTITLAHVLQGLDYGYP